MMHLRLTAVGQYGCVHGQRARTASVQRTWELQTQHFKSFINKMPPKNKKAVPAAATCDAESDGSEESEEMSDPEDDIADDEAMAVVDFEPCVIPLENVWLPGQGINTIFSLVS